MLCIPKIKAITLYSAGDGAWDDANTWSHTDGGPNGAGIPSTTDNVIIRSGDNVVGEEFFPAKFTRAGNMTIRAGGSFTLNGSAFFDFSAPDKELHVYGTFQTLDGNSRLRNQGFMHFHAGSMVKIGNDFEIFNTSSTIVDTDMIVGDDLRIVESGGQICGNGNIILGLATAAKVTNVSGGTGLNQVCPGVCIINDGPPGVTNCGEGGFSLPISLISFEIKDDILEWEVIESEVNAFEIYYSSDLDTWELLSTLDSQGDGQNIYRYSLTQEGYYRVQSVEVIPFISSTVFYQGVEKIAIRLYPNPIQKNQEVHIEGKDLQSLEIYDTQGKLIKRISLDHLTIPLNLPAGKYFMKIYTSEDVNHQTIIVE